MAFVVFEGLDGAGKSTLIKGVEKRLSRLSVSCVILRDPGTTPLGEKLRQLILDPHGEVPVPRAELLMYQAARVQMVEKQIQPALKQNQWVLCDRFYSSTVAFQGFARGLEKTSIEYLNHFVAHGCPPDLFVYLDISVEESEARKQGRSQGVGVEQDRMEQESRAFQAKVRQGYLHQSSQDPEHWLVLDGTSPSDQLVQATLNGFKKRQWIG